MKSHASRDVNSVQINEVSAECLSRQGQQEVQCIFAGCAFSSANRMQSHSMKRHPKRAADIADLSIVLEEGQPLAHHLTYDSDASISSDEEKDAKRDEPVNGQRKRTKTSFRDRTCSYCGKKFPSPSQLKNHIWVHTGEKPFSCDRCSSQFSQKKYLNIHMRRHMKDKPFACNLCESRFVTLAELQRHLTHHSGLRKFSCGQCSKKFALKSCLVTHMRVHTGEKPFPCDQCVPRGSRRKVI